MSETTKNQNKKLWIWIITGILLISGIGLIAYLFWPKKSTENKLTEQTTEKQSIQAFRNQVQQIKQVQKNLNQGILQHENILKERKKEANNIKQTEFDIKELKKLEKHITDLKTKKAKIEQILPKLEEKINNLSQETKPKPEVIREVELEIKGISEELSIPYEPQVKEVSSDNSLTKNKSASNPTSENTSPNNLTNSEVKNNPNLQQFQILRNQAQELVNFLEKIIQDHEKKIKDFNEANQQTKEAGFDMEEGEIGKIINDVKSYLGVAKSNKSTLEGYASEKDYQTFLSASSDTQKANLGLIEDAIKHTLKSTQEYLNGLLNHAQELLKIGEEMLEEFIKQEKEIQQDDEAEGTHLKANSKTREENAQKDLTEVKENKKTLASFQTKLTEMEQLSMAEQIKTIQEIWKKLEELDKSN